MCRKIVAAALAAALFTIGGCQRIQEPWVREDHPLTEERARTPGAQLALQHRFMDVQTDR